MDFGIQNKVALVAAASGGIGYASALELAREGARVFLCSRDGARAAEAAEKIKCETGAAVVVGAQADVTNDDDVKKFIALIREQAGDVEICVTNAGGAPATNFDATDLEAYRAAFELNALSAIRLAQAVVPAMRAKKWGRIINITSISVKQPVDGLLLSNTVRAGLTGWAKAVSNELAADGITVNNIAPGYTLTERQEYLARVRAEKMNTTPEALKQHWAELTPIKRLATPDEIAAAVAFLASTRASYITGVTLQVDGGYIKSIF